MQVNSTQYIRREGCMIRRKGYSIRIHIMRRARDTMQVDSRH